MKFSALSQITDSSDDSLLLLNYSTDGGTTFHTRAIRFADLADDIELSELNDVQADAPSVGDVLVWNGAQWIPGPQTGGSGLASWSEDASGHLIPNGSDQNIGSLANPVKELFLTANTLYIDGEPLSKHGGKLQWGGDAVALEKDLKFLLNGDSDGGEVLSEVTFEVDGGLVTEDNDLGVAIVVGYDGGAIAPPVS